MRTSMLSTAVAALLVTSVFSCGTEAFARIREKKVEAPQAVPRCPPGAKKPVIAIMFNEGRQGWDELSMSSPEEALGSLIQESSCFRIVDWNGPGAMALDRGYALSQSGQLQRGSGYGKGQLLAPDYYLVPKLVAGNKDSGGNMFGALIGGLLAGPGGAIAGGSIGTSKKEVTVTMYISNARTGERLHYGEATVEASDFSFNAGGAAFGTTGVGGAGGGVRNNTGMPKVIAEAYKIAFSKMILSYGAVFPTEYATGPTAAPKPALTAAKTVNLRTEPSTKAKIVRSIPAGTLLYQVPVDGSGVPNETADWIKVTDDQGWYTGWVSKLFVTTSVAPNPPY